MGLLERTPGELVDALITTSIKIFFFIEIETDETKSEHERFEAGQNVIKLNKKRNELIAILNTYLGHADESIKTY